MGTPGLGLGTHWPDAVHVCSSLSPGEEAAWRGSLREPKTQS